MEETRMLNKTLTKWVGYHFSTGPYTGKDYLSFQRSMRNDLKKQANANGLELHSFHGNHYNFCAVLRNTDTGKFVYVLIPDVRFWPDEWIKSVLYRTMKHEKDWVGGQNNHCPWAEIGRQASRLTA